MQTNVRNVALTFAVGVIVGLSIRDLVDRNAVPDVPRGTADEVPVTGPTPRPRADAPALITRDATSARETTVITAGAAAADRSPGPTTASGPQPAQQPPIPPAVLTNDIKARPAPLNGLLNASSLRCDIEVAQGANWSQGKATLHAINYQGGPFYVESIDPEAGTARMSGGSGVTGSMSGELEMRATAGNKGLTFSAFTRHGDLLIVTVYPALDSRGRYRTVMTTFGDQFDHETAQFFGACDISLARR